MNNEIEILKLLVELEVRLGITQQKLQAMGRHDANAGKIGIMQVNIKNAAQESWIIKDFLLHALKNEKV